MNRLHKISLSAIASFSLLLVPSVLVSCGSSSTSTEETEERIWTLTTSQFETGEYNINLASVAGPLIELVPNAGGNDGVMRVMGVSTPVEFFYVPEGNEFFPETASLTVTFVSPEDGSFENMVKLLGVTLLPADADDPDSTDTIVAGSSITFNLAYTPFTSVLPKALPDPSEEFDNVRADWEAFDEVAEVDRVLTSWVLLDMLREDFEIVKR